MKKYVLLLCITAMSYTTSSAQTIAGVELKSVDSEYIMIMGTARFLSTKLTITVDYGQSTKLIGKSQAIKDENGKLKKLNSMVDALNFFSKYGYEFKNAYAITVGNSNVYHWLLKKTDQ